MVLKTTLEGAKTHPPTTAPQILCLFPTADFFTHHKPLHFYATPTRFGPRVSLVWISSQTLDLLTLIRQFMDSVLVLGCNRVHVDLINRAFPCSDFFESLWNRDILGVVPGQVL